MKRSGSGRNRKRGAPVRGADARARSAVPVGGAQGRRAAARPRQPGRSAARPSFVEASVARAATTEGPEGRWTGPSGRSPAAGVPRRSCLGAGPGAAPSRGARPRPTSGAIADADDACAGAQRRRSPAAGRRHCHLRGRPARGSAGPRSSTGCSSTSPPPGREDDEAWPADAAALQPNGTGRPRRRGGPVASARRCFRAMLGRPAVVSLMRPPTGGTRCRSRSSRGGVVEGTIDSLVGTSGWSSSS